MKITPGLTLLAGTMKKNVLSSAYRSYLPPCFCPSKERGSKSFFIAHSNDECIHHEEREETQRQIK